MSKPTVFVRWEWGQAVCDREAWDACRRVALRECWIAAGGFPHAFDELQGDPTASVLALIGQLRVVASTVKNPLGVLRDQGATRNPAD